MSEGKKYDTGKLRYDLLDYSILDEMVRVLTFGAEKYGANNWQGVQKERYQAALGRHYSKYMQGEQNDPESGIHHLAHCMINCLFIMSKEKIKEKN